MKFYKKREVVKEEQYLDKMICDICKKETNRQDWTNSYDEIAGTEVSCKVGVHYPEFGAGTEFKIDICTDCFRDKLIPWVESHGSKIEEKEWEW